jgi:hypothetical protein
MNSVQSEIRSGLRVKSIWICVPVLLLLGIFGISGAAAADAGEQGGFWDAVTNGKPSLNMRARIEIADKDLAGAAKSRQSEAYTLRTRLGYGTKSWHGGMLFAEAENTTAIATRQYHNAVEPPTGRTTIADPTNTEVNQAYLKIQREDLIDYTIIGGRQRIKLDDDRFVGNVGWRQNEQTYDAILGASSLGVEDLKVTYAYLRYVRRIFGERDESDSATQDWKSNGHIINASYGGFDVAKLTAFIYILDLMDDAANTAADSSSSATYGFRLSGAQEVADKLKLSYEGSYAYQKDHADNPADYKAHYVWTQIKATQSDLGSVGAGYELLGSDDGDARFVTPLATAHKFNGWADVFLDNGAGAGLQDLFISVAPKLPCKLTGSLVYHRFWSDEGDTHLGDEWDLIVKRPVNEHLSVLLKSAYFDTSDASRDDIWRLWLQADLKF